MHICMYGEALYHENMNAVQVDGGLSDWFETGCILTPLLFNILTEVRVVIALARYGNEIDD